MLRIVDRGIVCDLEGFHAKAFQEEACFALALFHFASRINVPSGRADATTLFVKIGSLDKEPTQPDLLPLEADAKYYQWHLEQDFHPSVFA